MDDLDARPAREARTKPGGELAVDLDRPHPVAAAGELAGENARAGADVEDERVARDLGCPDDLRGQPRRAEEVLCVATLWRRPARALDGHGGSPW